MADQEDDLRATTEDIQADAEELAAIEREKAQLEPDDPRLRALSRKGEQVARRLVPKTAVERELVDQATGASRDTSPSDEPSRAN